MSSSAPLIEKTEIFDFQTDERTQLELRLARHADELAKTRGQDQALEFWMEAERKVLTCDCG